MPIIEAWLMMLEARSIQRIRRVRATRRSTRPAKPGWFYDPRKEAAYRYWNGSGWTEDTAAELPR